MRRAFLLTVTALGMMVCLLGGTGLFAALSDSASTGTNRVTTNGLPPSADLKLASADHTSAIVCHTFADDLTTGLISETDLAPGSAGQAWFCLRNDGSAAMGSMRVIADGLSDVDHDCTGDEQDSGDATCGGDKAGELSDVLTVLFIQRDCGSGAEVYSSAEVNLRANASTPLALPTPAAGETMCFQAQISYRIPPQAADVQKAQSDTVTWRFKFTAQT